MSLAIDTGVVHHSEKLLFRGHRIIVKSVAISRFADEVITLREELRRRENMGMCTSEVACISQPFPPARLRGSAVRVFVLLIDLQRADSRTEHVPGVGEREEDVVEKTETPVVAIGDEMAHSPLHIVLIIKRFDLVFLALLLMRMLAVDLLVVRADILLLYKSGVGQHERTEVTRGGRTIDVSAEAEFVDIRNQPGMVDMRMRKNHTIKRFRVEAQVPVGGIGLHAFALIHTAIQENRVSGIGGNKMFASRHFAGGAEELYFHGFNDLWYKITTFFAYMQIFLYLCSKFSHIHIINIKLQPMESKDLFDLSGRVSLVTGCSGGLGVQMAKALAAKGSNLVIIARRYEKLVEVKNEIEQTYSVEVLPLQCDITNTEAVETMVDEAIKHFGRIDIVVNNAGTGAVAPAEDITDAQFENEMQIDLFGSFRVARAVAKKTMIPNQYGRIINIASMYGLVGNKIAPASPYHAAKGGVVNMTRALAAEWGKHGITVNAICPGYFITPLTKETLESEYFANYAKTVIPMERYGHEGELDSAVCFLAADASRYVTGVALPVDGGYTCV